MSKKKRVQDDNLMEVEQALTRTEQFIEKNQKILTIVVGAIIVIVAIVLGFKKLYMQPIEKEAQAQMYFAEQYFEKDSFNLALNGDGNYPGFLDIIDDYGITSSANLASYYCGISYLHLGQFEEAIDYLNDFKTDDLNLNVITAGAKGDAYLELGEQEKALLFYKEATAIENSFAGPIYMLKLGQLYENMKQTDKAVETYETLKEKYPNSNEGRSAEKYIARANATK